MITGVNKVAFSYGEGGFHVSTMSKAADFCLPLWGRWVREKMLALFYRRWMRSLSLGQRLLCHRRNVGEDLIRRYAPPSPPGEGFWLLRLLDKSESAGMLTGVPEEAFPTRSQSFRATRSQSFRATRSQSFRATQSQSFRTTGEWLLETASSNHTGTLNSTPIYRASARQPRS